MTTALREDRDGAREHAQETLRLVTHHALIGEPWRSKTAMRWRGNQHLVDNLFCVEESYDLIVIGSGVAASAVAMRCRAEKWRVAVVDREPFGGTCALRGCDPKKVLVGIAEAIDRVRRLRGKGAGGGEPAIDWAELQAFKRSFTDPVPDRRVETFRSAGIDTYRGQARLTGPRTIQIGSERLEARYIVIASGAVPRTLHIPGEQHLATSSDFLALARLPRRIVLLGGGYIAAEFSHIAARAGAQVVVLEQADELLPQFDPELVRAWIERSRALGIELRLGARVEAVESGPAGLKVVAASAEGRFRVSADLVVHAAGRVPDLDALDLDAAGVAHDEHRLELNEFLQSASNPSVYAAGDAAGAGPALTPVANLEGDVVAENLLHGNRRRANYLGIPSVVYTIPALARVGILESQARAQGLRFRVRHENTSNWYTARRVNESCAGFKILVEAGSEHILGAHLLGPAAEEVINLFALTIRSGLTATQLKQAVFAYPTAGSDLAHML